MKTRRDGTRLSGHDIQYLVRPADAAAPKFYVRGHTPTDASAKARAKLLGMREHFECGFDLIPIEKRA